MTGERLAGLAAALGLGLASPAFAATPPTSAYLGALTTQNQIPASVLSKYGSLTREALARSRAPGVLTPQMHGFIDSERNKAAAETGVEKREALSQLGINGTGTGTLYILVSSSMPKKMLREYAAEAIYTGAIIDFRGVLANKPYPLTWFLKHEILPLFSKNPNARPTITIDSRPFALWNVHAVPAIVYTTVSSERLCPQQDIRTTHAVNDVGKKITVPYHHCAPMPPARYWEVSGAVTLHYALERFIQDGAASARPLLRALDDGEFSKNRAVSGIKAGAYAKMQTPGGIDSVMDAIKAEGFLPKTFAATQLNPLVSLSPSIQSESAALGDK